MALINTSPFKLEVNKAMRKLAGLPDVVFIGQSVAYDGAAIYTSLEGVSPTKRLEFPVVENLQVGYCTGLSLGGKLPICIFPRMDFMLLALDQIVNHLDKLPTWGWRPKVIMRCRVGEKKPLNAGPQHTQNHTQAFRQMLTTIQVEEVRIAEEVEPAYNTAIASRTSTLIVENPYG